MDQKAAVLLEAVKNERKYTLTIPMNAPYGEAYDFCFECLSTLIEMAQKAAEQAKKNMETKAPDKLDSDGAVREEGYD